MSFSSSPSNTATQANIDQMDAISAYLTPLKTTAGTTSETAMNLNFIYQQLKDARRMAFSNITSTSAFDNLISALAPISVAWNNYVSGTGTFSSVQTAMSTFTSTNSSKITDFNTAIDEFTRKWSLQDRVFFEYSRSGEADLNNQLGQLGDALDSLSKAMDVINSIDLTLSINPRHNSTGLTLVESDSTLSENYQSNGSSSLFIPRDYWSFDSSSNVNASTNYIAISNNGLSTGDRVIVSVSGTAPGGLTNGSVYYVVNANANGSFQLSTSSGGSAVDISTGSGTVTLTRQINVMRAAYNAYQELDAIKGGFDAGSPVYSAIQDVISSLQSRGVTGWSAAVDPPSDTGNTWSSSYVNYWQDTTLRRYVNNLQTSLSSQNDIEKQNLRKALFIYQEFVKSAGTVMDRVYDAVKGIASRIGR